jgi:death-on-curing protein
MVRYLFIDEILAIHKKMIDLFGGKKGIRDFTLLHAASERPKATFASRDLYPTIFDKAAALIQSLILNHPFNDGNKRTALAACALFMFYNYHLLKFSQKEAIQFVLKINSHQLKFDQISLWIKKHSKKLSRDS